MSEAKPSPLRELGWRDVLRFLIYVVLLPMVLFAAAGRLDWGMAWIYVGIHVAFALGSRLVVALKNPGLLVERARAFQTETAPAWDRALVMVGALLGPLAVWLVAGLDERLGWAGDVSPTAQWVALAGVVLGYAFGAWAMLANAYFSAVVRIQEDRGQQVITGGPYRIVRHPAYAGAVLVYLAMPLMLGSLWALIPAGPTIAVLVVRTLLEDRALLKELPGYQDYARRTRYRLVPGVW